MSDIDTPPVCYRHPNRTSYIQCQRCGRHICPECQTQAAVGVQCPECIRAGRADMPRRAPGFVRALRPSGTPLVTYLIMALCIVLFAAQWISGGAVDDALVLDPTLVGAEPWRLVTSAFLHSRDLIVHILFNMYALFIFGPVLERFLGHARFVALYLIGAVGGSVGMVLVYALAIATNGASIEVSGGLLQPASSLGASGAVFALLGALFVLRNAIGIRTGQLLILIGINLALPFFVPGIAWEAHLGGLVVGAAVGLVLLRTRRPDQVSQRILGLAAIAGVLIAILVACVAVSPALYGLI